MNNHYKSEFDTIALSIELDNFNSLNINQNYFNHNSFSEIIDNEKINKVQKLELKKNYRKNIFGLESLQLVHNSYYGNSIEIKHNAKILKDRYIDNIHKDNIINAYDSLFNTELKEVVKLDYEKIITNSLVGQLDFNKHITINNSESVDYLKAIQNNLIPKRNSKIKDDFINNKTLYVSKNKQSKIKIYEKHNHLISDKKHFNFINNFNNVLSESVDKLRIEQSIIGRSFIGMKLYRQRKAISLEQALNNNKNVMYDDLQTLINTKNFNYDDFRLKDIIFNDDIILGNYYFNRCNGNYNKLYELIKLEYEDKNKRYKAKIKYFNLMKKYIDYVDKKENRINYFELFDNFMNKLKTA